MQMATVVNFTLVKNELGVSHLQSKPTESYVELYGHLVQLLNELSVHIHFCTEKEFLCVSKYCYILFFFVQF